MNNTVQFPAIIDGVAMKKDGSLSLRLGTPELGPEDTSQIFSHGNKQVWAALSEVAISHEDLDIPEKLIEPTDKSKAQRLRSVMYLVAKKQNKDPDGYYAKRMEQYIEHEKEKLN